MCRFSTDIVFFHGKATAESFVFITFIRNAATIGVPFAVVPWLNSMSLTKISIICGCVATSICFSFIPILIWGRDIRVALHARYDKLVAKTQDVGAFERT